VQVVLAGCFTRAVSSPSQPSSFAAPAQSGLPAPEEPARWFSEQVHVHDGRLKAYLRGSFPTIGDVEDLVQESYLRIWKRRLLGPVASAQSFLYKIARNLAVDMIRRKARSPLEPVSDLGALSVLDTGPSAAEAACTREELDLLLEAIEALPPRCREVVILRKLRGLSPREISDQLGISEGTVHIHGGRGVRRCEEFLRARGVVLPKDVP
jgi:RNA polymerase sigma factor (sigma-70 family)